MTAHNPAAEARAREVLVAAMRDSTEKFMPEEYRFVTEGHNAVVVDTGTAIAAMLAFATETPASAGPDQVQHMVSRFLQWKLPANFAPDAGINFKAEFNEGTAHPMRHEPVGTNLFTAVQAEGMVRFMLDGLPAASAQPAGGVERYRHKARGTEYTLIGTAELQDATGAGVEESALLAVYRGDDGKLWARRRREFGDGRFEWLPDLTHPSTSADNGEVR